MDIIDGTGFWTCGSGPAIVVRDVSILTGIGKTIIGGCYLLFFIPCKMKILLGG